MKKYYGLGIACLVAVLLVSYICFGTVNFSLRGLFTQHSEMMRLIIVLRLNRMICGLLVGAILALCGVIMQNIFRNPIADPYILGISSGAGMGVALSLFLGVFFPLFNQGIVTTILAFICALSSCFIGLIFSRVEGEIVLMRLLLIGMALTFFQGAFIQLVFSINILRNFNVFLWLMGSLSSVGILTSFLFLGILLVLIFVVFTWHKAYDLMLLGSDIAKTSGVNVERVKILSLILVALSVSIVVSFCGIIGFVGMIVPHAIRLVIGPKNKSLLFYSMGLGGVFVVFCDFIARMAILPSELPLGAVIGLIGAPYFLILLLQMKRGRRL